MMFQILNVLISKIFYRIKFVKFVFHKHSLNTTIMILINLSIQICYIFHSHIGIAIFFRWSSGIVSRINIFHHIINSFLKKSCFSMFSSIQNIRFCHFKISKTHQFVFNNILDNFYFKSICFRKTFFNSKLYIIQEIIKLRCRIFFCYCFKSRCYCFLNLTEIVRYYFPVSFNYFHNL